MSRPGATDRERIFELEAENAALREELAVWRWNEHADRAELAEVLRLDRLAERLRANVGPNNGRGRTVAAALAFLARHPGAPISAWRLGEAVAARQTESPDAYGKVMICLARRGLRALGLANVVKTVWGHGYMIEVRDAPAVLALMEPADG